VWRSRWCVPRPHRAAAQFDSAGGVLPILLYIGLVIGAQAFQASPSKHAPAVVLAIIPNIAEWAKINIDGALGAAGTSADKVGMAALGQVGVVYQAWRCSAADRCWRAWCSGRWRRSSSTASSATPQ